ncbi:MAG: nicotinate-nucleotide adenylyltransferase [Lachnospiraceae bacterium]|nr:nicotinate-nucleotide adenylyltransferase [Lachnospiraceae bacterium]
MGMKKTGIMGGTFNPIHYGHLLLAESAYNQFDLDEVLFMPSKNPPHKRELFIIDEAHRAEMVRLAIADNPHFVFSGEELEREGYTYTADTLEILTSREPDTQFCFIIGGDSLMQFESWRRPETILQLACVLAAERDGMSLARAKEQIAHLNRTYNADVRLLLVPNIEISSHDIRERCMAGRSIRYLTPEPVRRYILEHGLYRQTSLEPSQG